MKKLVTIIISTFILYNVNAQNYKQQIDSFRSNYKNEFLQDEKSPLKQNDLQYLNFFEANKSFCTTAKFSKIIDTIGFIMQTHSGKEKQYFKYGKITFSIHHRQYHLFVYQSKTLMKIEKYKEELFIPFTDYTNYKTTFGGGRYLDIKINDIQNNKLILDFNKCYNPYCAYAGGYNCPIPPKENNLLLQINAGEKLFKK